MRAKPLLIAGLLFLLAAVACTRPMRYDSQSPIPTQVEFTPLSPSELPLLLTPSPFRTLLPPASTSEPTSTSTPQPKRFAVFQVAEGGVLNVRAGAGVTNDVIGTLEANSRDLSSAGSQEEVDGEAWLEINQPEGGTGWVYMGFITEQVSSDQFCADGRVQDLLDQLSAAIQAQDGSALARLVSPLHGLFIRHEWWNPEVHFSDPQVVSNLFSSTVDYDWGKQDGSGEPIVGPFKDIILPELEDVLSAAYSGYCNTLEKDQATGNTAGLVKLPFEYQNLNYVSLYRAAKPDDEMNWRTWAVGIEYVDGKPYLCYLIQYHWEI
jgi:hypothetical protein